MREYLKELRCNRNLTQQNIANELGVSLSYYNSIEKGNRQKNMELLMANRLSKVLQVPVDFIITEEEKLAQKSA
ncbi:MAG: helix-turn-helix domain-containing protein [Oscillospiraceae bacterium]|jgi:transcriptional regulator with XRE-family HTH domain|nr:helix-turn-helix domain-containing protein [Oscillospiraceae bacterium]